MLHNQNTGKILVTGGAGFIGSYVSKYLISAGFDVISLKKSSCNLLDPEEVNLLFENHNIKAVIHCAAKTGFREDEQSLTTFYDNILMYENLTKNTNTLFINLGSGAEFDNSVDISDYSETKLGERIPTTPYGFSKYVIANRVAQNCNQVNFRLFNIFGPQELDSRFIKTAIKNVISKEPIIVFEDIKMDFFFVEDLCFLLIHYLTEYATTTNPGLPRDINVCYNDKYTLHEVATIINSFTSQQVPIWTKHYNKNKNNYYGDGSLLASLGVSFCGLSAGIEKTFKTIKKS